MLDVRLETGRTHQVRVHLSAIGHPVTGDDVYGAPPALAAELGLSRPALHARLLRLTHPVTGARVEVEEPLPKDLVMALIALRSEGREDYHETHRPPTDTASPVQGGRP